MELRPKFLDLRNKREEEMSLYSCEEVCTGCRHSNWHNCCNTFCSCDIDKEIEIDGLRGTCQYGEWPTEKEELEEEKKK